MENLLKYCVVFVVPLLLFKLIWQKYFKSKSKNPFVQIEYPARPIEMDRKVRKKVLKKAFRPDRIPSELDAIIIGSGIGSLTCAGLMARSGKRVLVLEQHDRVGGCTHTYKSKGCEFDIGIHYIGNMEKGSMNKCLIDLLTDDQLEWVKIHKNFDTVVIDKPESAVKKFVCKEGILEFKKDLLAYFPKEQKAIERFFALLKASRSATTVFAALKIIPKSLVGAFLWLKLDKIFLKSYNAITQKSLQQTIDELTDDKELKTVLVYCFGDYGVVPKESCFFMHSMLFNHLYRTGGFYPKGGASEIAYQMLPGIERSGGSALTQAFVKEILIEDGKACGVRVAMPNSTEHEIRAPLIISGAGVYNTYKGMIPRSIYNKYNLMTNLTSAKPGLSCLQIMVGLEGTKEELGIEAKNYWIFSSDDPTNDAYDYLSSSREEAVNKHIPLLFVSFPSTKDPTWNERFPNKSTCIIVTFSSLSWFDEWSGDKAKKRGAVYDSLKSTFINQAWSQTLRIFPHLKDKVNSIEGGSPLSHVHYLNSMHGEIYGLHHNKERFHVDQAAELRPETPIPRLILAGQDVFTCGFMGGAFGGMLAAATALDRYLILDWINLVKDTRKKL